MTASLTMYVIYDRPLDAPGGFLVRAWTISAEFAGMAIPGKVLGRDLSTIELARTLVPAGLHNIGRTSYDDPKIVEVWV